LRDAGGAAKRASTSALRGSELAEEEVRPAAKSAKVRGRDSPCGPRKGQKLLEDLFVMQ
jgi:hypothetical protein